MWPFTCSCSSAGWSKSRLLVDWYFPPLVYFSGRWSVDFWCFAQGTGAPGSRLLFAVLPLKTGCFGVLFCHCWYQHNWRLKKTGGLVCCYAIVSTPPDWWFCLVLLFACFAMVGTSVTGGSRLVVLFGAFAIVGTSVTGGSRLAVFCQLFRHVRCWLVVVVVCNQQHVGDSDVSPVLVVVMQVFCPFWWAVF